MTRLAQVKIVVDKSRMPRQSLGSEARYLLDGLRNLPAKVMGEAHQFIMGEVPVYTGTYQGAIKFTMADTPAMSSAAIFLDRETLLASAGQHKEPAFVSEKYPMQTPQQYVQEYIFAVPGEDTFRLLVPEDVPDSGIYPERIEAEGSPVQHEGQALWDRTAEFASILMDVQISNLEQGLWGGA